MLALDQNATHLYRKVLHNGAKALFSALESTEITLIV